MSLVLALATWTMISFALCGTTETCSRPTGTSNHSSVDLHEASNQLHEANVSTIVFLEDNMPMQTNTNSCDSVIWTEGFVVLGRYDFSENVFKQVLQYTEACYLGNKLFASQWLTAMTEDELQASPQLFQGFQHLAAVVTSKTGNLSLWTLRHTKDVSDMSYVRSLPPTLPLSRHCVLPNLAQGLGGRTLRVVTKEYAVQVTKDDSGLRGEYQGVAIDILHELSLRLNFSYVFVALHDDYWGQEVEGGQWNGLIGMLTRKEVDLASASLAISEDRTSVADATTPFMYDSSVVLFSVNSTQDRLTFFTQPFQPLVYVAAGGCFLMVLVLLMSFETCQEILHRVTSGTHQWACFRLMANSEILVAGLVAKPIDKDSTSRGGRVLVVTWLLLGMVLASVYSSQLTSSMTVRQQTLPFTSLSQLLGQDTYTWGFLSGGFAESMLKLSTTKDIRRYYQRTMALAEGDPQVASGDLSVHLTKVLHDNYAFFSSNTMPYYLLAANNCDIKRLTDMQMTSAFSFYLQKGSPYTKLLSDEISKMTDSGLIDFWRRKWLPRPRQCEPAEDEKSGKVIGLTETQTAFYLAALGLATAGLALLLEIMGRRHVSD